MGELVAGQPALQLGATVSLPLDLGSTMSLLYRAVPGGGLDPWLVSARRSLSDALRYDLDLLHGFSGRLIYYLEEPIMRFGPLDDGRRDASFEDFIAHLERLSPETFRSLAVAAVQRVRRDQDLDPAPPPASGNPVTEEVAWRRFLEPGLTTATADEIVPLLLDPAHLRARTIGLFRGVWESVYREEFARQRPALEDAARRAAAVLPRGFGLAFSELTGSRLPATLLTGMNDVTRVTFCPSAHLGSFVSYVRYPPDVVVFFGLAAQAEAPFAVESVADTARSSPVVPYDELAIADMVAERASGPLRRHPLGRERAGSDAALPDDLLLDSVRALGDPTRLRVLDLLRERERYAQEIVAELGIAQSAVSRHLSQLERAGLVRVRPQRGMKYYAVDPERVASVAGTLISRFSP